jgi:O-antigen/teichoic acid export membrane protein
MTDRDTSTTPTPSAPVRPKTSFSGDVLKLVSGTTIAQLLGILASPILTRLYAPEAFGLLALFTSITSILSVIACLRYELAIMLPESDEEAANLLGVSLIFTVLISLLTAPIVWWGGELIVGWINSPGLLPYLWLIPPMTFVSGVFLALNYWNSRTKQFGRLSIARVSQSVTTTSVQIGFGLGGLATGGVMIGTSVGGKALATAVLGGQIWRDDGRMFLQSIQWSHMFTGVKRYRKFPLYDTWSALLNTASWQLPAFLLAGFFSSWIVGYYVIGFRILQLPMSFVGDAISQVFFQRLSINDTPDTRKSFTEKIFRLLVVLSLSPMLLVLLIGPDLFSVVFGSNWVEAGIYAQILSIWTFFWFISSPLSTVFSVLEQQETLLKFNLINFSTRFVALYIGGVLQHPQLSIFLFSISGILVYGYLILRVLRQMNVSIPKAVFFIGKNILVPKNKTTC